jgi:nitronate monooxygenase
MLKTKFTELTGCRVPIQMAAIGSLARPPLAAAISNAGGLGMLQLSGFTQAQASRWLEEVRKRTGGVFGANFIVTEAWYPDLEELRGVVETASKQARVVEFFYRQPDSSLVDLVHKNGALASWQVGSNDEAVAAAKAGCDLIVAQGIEAGGHIRGRSGCCLCLSRYWTL